MQWELRAPSYLQLSLPMTASSICSPRVYSYVSLCGIQHVGPRTRSLAGVEQAVYRHLPFLAKSPDPCHHGCQVSVCRLLLFSTTAWPQLLRQSSWQLGPNCSKIPGNNFASADQRAPGQAQITLGGEKDSSAFTALLGSCLCQAANFESWEDAEKTLSHDRLPGLRSIMAKVNSSQQIH